MGSAVGRPTSGTLPEIRPLTPGFSAIGYNTTIPLRRAVMQPGTGSSVSTAPTIQGLHPLQL